MRSKCALGTALLLLLSGCARKAPQEARPLSSGDAVWLRDGTGADSAALEDALLRSAFAAVYLPARTLGTGEQDAAVSPPSVPLARIPVVLVIAAGDSFDRTLRSATGPAREAVIQPVVRAASTALAERQRFGKVVGVHLDVPFSPESLEAFAELVASVRRQVPGQYRLTASLGFSPGEDERKPLSAIDVDGWTVNVFGEAGVADVLAVDAVDTPWWAVYAPGARGVWRSPDGTVRGMLGEKYLSALSELPQVDVAHDLTWKEEWASAYLLRPRQPVEAAGLTFQPGEIVSFSMPSLPEMLSRLGADVSARRNAKGRVIVLQGTSEQDRIFTLSALGDVLLGRPLDPDVRVTVGPVGKQVVVGAENAAVHASVLSRTANWVEMELPAPGVRDVAPGGFERYEAYDAREQPVTPGRALRLRFYETLLGPYEKVEPARITLRVAPPASCCRWRSRYISAAGREITTDWAAPEPTPTPIVTPRAKR